MRMQRVGRRLCGLAATGVLVLAGCGGDDSEADRPASAPPIVPAELAATCARVTADADANLPVLCPPASRGPTPPREERLHVIHEDLDPDPCAYLAALEPDADGRRPFHMVLGARCDPLDLTVRGGRWAAEPLESLRLIVLPPLQSGKTPMEMSLLRPKLVRRLRVRGQPGLLLLADPPPPGGLHGGHDALVWNEGGRGYALSLHWPRGDRGEPPRTGDAGALLRLAAAMVPTP